MSEELPKHRLHIVTDFKDIDVSANFKAADEKLDAFLPAKIDEVLANVSEQELRDWVRNYLYLTTRLEILGSIAEDIKDHPCGSTKETRELVRDILQRKKALENYDCELADINYSAPWCISFEIGWISNREDEGDKYFEEYDDEDESAE